jgi:hypothetical protein
MDAVFIEEIGWRILWDFSFFCIFLFCYCFYYGGGVNMAEFRCVFCFCCLFYVCYRNLITNAIMFGCKSVCIVCVEGCQLGRGVGLGFSGFLQEDGLFAVINLFWLLLRLGWMMWCKLQNTEAISSTFSIESKHQHFTQEFSLCMYSCCVVRKDCVYYATGVRDPLAISQQSMTPVTEKAQRMIFKVTGRLFNIIREGSCPLKSMRSLRYKTDAYMGRTKILDVLG